MAKDRTVITLFPEESFRLTNILLDEDRDAAWDFLANVIKKRVGESSRPQGRLVFELQHGRVPEFLASKAKSR
jgi:hypothetical protein